MKKVYLIYSPINNYYLSNQFANDHEQAFTVKNYYTANSSTLNPDLVTFSDRNKAYDSAKNQGHLHGFEPIVVKVVI